MFTTTKRNDHTSISAIYNNCSFFLISENFANHSDLEELECGCEANVRFCSMSLKVQCKLSEKWRNLSDFIWACNNDYFDVFTNYTLKSDCKEPHENNPPQPWQLRQRLGQRSHFQPLRAVNVHEKAVSWEKPSPSGEGKTKGKKCVPVTCSPETEMNLFFACLNFIRNSARTVFAAIAKVYFLMFSATGLVDGLKSGSLLFCCFSSACKRGGG